MECVFYHTKRLIGVMYVMILVFSVIKRIGMIKNVRRQGMMQCFYEVMKMCLTSFPNKHRLSLLQNIPVSHTKVINNSSMSM